MAAPATVASALQLGFRFEPTPRDAVTYYLPRLIAGEPMHAAIRPYIHAANVYACAPGELAAQFLPTPGKDDRFFLTTVERQRNRTGKDVRYVRVAGPGSWAFQRSEDVKDGNNGKVGEMRKLRYKKGGAFTDWLMDEYSCACAVKAAVVGDGNRELVFCRIYVSPNAGADSAARRESAAVFAPPPVPPPQTPAPATTSKKRPAPVVLPTRPPCPKRVRGAPISPVRPPPSPRPGTVPTSMQPAPLRPCTVQITGPMIKPAMAPLQQPSYVAGARAHRMIPEPPAPPRPGMIPTLMQPGRSPAPAPLQPPSQQLKSLMPRARAHHMIPEPPAPPRPAVTAPPVKQEPLTPPPASPDPLLPTVDDPAVAEDDGFSDLINDIESSLPTTEDNGNMHGEAGNDGLDDLVDDSEASLPASEADGDTHQQVASSSDGIADVNEQVPPQLNEADDDLDQFANTLDGILLVEEEEDEGHQHVALPQKEARKCLDQFEAAFADEAE